MVVVHLSGRGMRELNIAMAFLRFLGGDNHGTVSASGTIKRRSGGSLQDIDAFHIIHIHGTSSSDGSVDNIDRFATNSIGIGCRSTKDYATLAEGCSGRSVELGSSYLSGKRVTERVAACCCELLLAHRLG